MTLHTPTDGIVRFASGLKYEDIPGDVIEHCKLVMLDALGCAIAASTLGDGCRQAITGTLRHGQSGNCAVFGTSRRAGPADAAFLNGALVHALNYDATGRDCGHQGVVCLAAPFALGELWDASGRDLIVSSVVACEVGARITAAIARTGRHPSEKFLAGQLLSYLGATAGAGRMARLGADQMHSALGLALMQMAGTRQVVLAGDPPAKSIYGGFPNQAAVQAVFLAQAGVDACCELFGEPAGLYSMIYDGEYLPAVLMEELGQRFLLLDATIKPWPCSDKIHDAIRAGLALRKCAPGPEQIAKIIVYARASLKPWCEPGDERRRPQNASSAANSVQYCLAKILQNGRLSPNDFSPAAREDPTTLRLTQATDVIRAEQGRPSRIAIEFADGARVETPLGDAGATRSREVDRNLVAEKFHDCVRFAENVFTPAEARRFADAFFNLEKVGRVRDLWRSGA